MKIATLPTTVDILYNGKFYGNVLVSPSKQCSWINQWHIPGGAWDGVNANIVETEDYEDRFDIYHNMSDDGTQFYTVIHVLDDDGTPPPPPIDPEVMETVRKDILKRAMDYYMISKRGCIEDYTFLGNVLTPTWMYKRVRDAGGDVQAASEKMVEEVFLHGETMAQSGWT